MASRDGWIITRSIVNGRVLLVQGIGDLQPVASAGHYMRGECTTEEYRAVASLLGREPRRPVQVVVRDEREAPVVISNAPILEDGIPMPTRYWLVDPNLKTEVSKLESRGGIREALREVDPDALQDAHERYARERDQLVPSNWSGPKPSGGVGGTRRGIKCLHAHLAWTLAGGDDPVGRFVAGRLGIEPLDQTLGSSHDSSLGG
jgi:hypothetical protein